MKPKSMHEEIEELRSLSQRELTERYAALFGKAPRIRNRTHLWRRCAWKLQEERLGGLSGVARRQLDELISDIDFDAILDKRAPVEQPVTRSRRPGEPLPGTELRREWHGKNIVVHVRENGYEYEGELFRSLSAVARSITGTRWNGPLFFGLRGKKSR